MPNSYSNSPNCPKYDCVSIFIFSYFFVCGNSSVTNLFFFSFWNKGSNTNIFLYFKKKDKRHTKYYNMECNPSFFFKKMKKWSKTELKGINRSGETSWRRGHLNLALKGSISGDEDCGISIINARKSLS